MTTPNINRIAPSSGAAHKLGHAGQLLRRGDACRYVSHPSANGTHRGTTYVSLTAIAALTPHGQGLWG